MNNEENRKTEGLHALGNNTKYAMDYAPEVLETFTNKHPENDYWVQFNCPEFTSLCPITGQPDFAKKNKVWNAEKKQVVDLKIKWWNPKPFDRVITRCDNNDIWTANIFSHMNSYGEYVAIGCVGGYHYCLPYNDETAHLIGTTDEWKGGEQ